MMKNMGWSGKGLGLKGEGPTEPIKVQHNDGMGLGSTAPQQQEILPSSSSFPNESYQSNFFFFKILFSILIPFFFNLGIAKMKAKARYEFLNRN